MCKNRKTMDLNELLKLVRESPKELSDEDLLCAIKQCVGPNLITEQKYFETELMYRNIKATNRYSHIIIALTIVIAFLTAVMVIKMFI